MDLEGIIIDEEKVKRLERKIIMKENNNLKSREKSDSQMIKWIMDLIEEEVTCYSNQ